MRPKWEAGHVVGMCVVLYLMLMVAVYTSTCWSGPVREKERSGEYALEAER